MAPDLVHQQVAAHGVAGAIARLRGGPRTLEPFAAPTPPVVNLTKVLDGWVCDPDRPIVWGSLYHQVNTPPYPLPKNRTKAVFRDASTPHNGGYNELTFDSAAGQEEVFLRAQRNSRVQVLRDAGPAE